MSSPKNAGRKPLAESEKMKPWSGKLRQDQIEFLKSLKSDGKSGGKFVRDAIDAKILLQDAEKAREAILCHIADAFGIDRELLNPTSNSE